MHPTINYFKEYKGDCKVFIETGTYKGNGLNLAIAAGFLTIHSIDIVNHPDKCYKYPGTGDIRLYIDDSPRVLSWLLPKITEHYMMWLDAHSQMMEDEPDNYPLLNELAIILEQPHLPHVILIDDWLYMTHPKVTGFNGDDIIDTLVEKGYTVVLLPNPIKNNILIAYV